MRFGALILVLVIVLGGGAFGLLVLNGTIKLNSKPAPKRREVPAGATLVPFTFQALTANTVMTRETLTDPRTGRIVMEPIFLESLKGREVMTSPIDIVGRVLRHDKKPGYVFSEKDFYPKGTRAGLTAAIPPGKRSVTLKAEKLSGARFLKTGDRVDLLAAQEYDPTRMPRPAAGKTPATGDPPVKKATVKVLAQDAVVVTPITVEQVPYSGKDGRTKTKPQEELEVAVDPEEVATLMEAVAAGADISCVVHSGQPEQPDESKRLIVLPTPPPAPPEAPPAPPPRTIETIIGRKHTTVVLPPTTAPSSGAPATAEQAMDGAHAAARQGGQP